MPRRGRRGAAARALSLQRARASAEARRGQPVSQQTIIAPVELSTVRSFNSIFNYILNWAVAYYECSEEEARTRLKLGSREGGVPISELRLAFVDYAVMQDHGIHSRLIAEKGEEEASRVMENIKIYSNLSVKDVDRQTGMSRQDLFRHLGLPENAQNRYAMTHSAIVTAWKHYFDGVRRLRLLDIPMNSLSSGVADPYPPEQKSSMMQMFSVLKRRGLLQSA